MIVSIKGNTLYWDHRLAPNTSYCKRGKQLVIKRNRKGINVMQNPSLFPEEQFKARILLMGNLDISLCMKDSTLLIFLNISRFILITFCLVHYWKSSEGPEASTDGYIQWGWSVTNNKRKSSLDLKYVCKIHVSEIPACQNDCVYIFCSCCMP